LDTIFPRAVAFDALLDSIVTRGARAGCYHFRYSKPNASLSLVYIKPAMRDHGRSPRRAAAAVL
jgi:hypothetical protein